MSGERHLRAVGETDPVGGGRAAEPTAATAPSGALSPEQRAGLRRARRAARWVGLILPLALVAVGTALLIAWVPRMPDPAATHWGLSGGPDGFGSPWSYVWLLGGLGGGLVLLFWAMGFLSGLKAGAPLWSSQHRFLAALAAGYAAFATVNNVGSAAVQLDLSDAARAPGVTGPMVAAFAVWILVAVAGWFAQPRFAMERDPAAASSPLPLGEHDRAVWIREVRVRGGVLGFLLLASAAVVGAAVFTWFTPSPPGVRWLMIGVAALVLGLGATTLGFRVRIDGTGLTARSIAGWPRIRVPAEKVESVEAARIDPFGEFGGWGLRWVPGRLGIVLRGGEGIAVTHSGGRLLAVTVDDAETGAAMLAAAAERARGDREASGRG